MESVQTDGDKTPEIIRRAIPRTGPALAHGDQKRTVYAERPN